MANEGFYTSSLVSIDFSKVDAMTRVIETSNMGGQFQMTVVMSSGAVFPVSSMREAELVSLRQAYNSHKKKGG